MGQVIDVPITEWDDMFLPAEVGKRMEEFYYTDSDGNVRKLIPSLDSVETIYTAHGRHPILEVPKRHWTGFLGFGLVLSVIMGFFFYLYYRNIRVGKILAGLSMSINALVFGLAGTALFFMNIFTNHDYTYQNYNMIYCTPLLLVSVPLGFCYAFSKNEKKLKQYSELLRIIWLLCVLGVIFSMLINLLPPFYQKNLTEQLLMLPIAVVFAFQPVGLNQFLEKYFKIKKCFREGING